MKLGPTVSTLALSTLVAALATSPANAQTANVGDFYLGLNAGVLIPDDMSFNVPGTNIGGGETITASGHFTFDTGAAAGLLVGCHVTEWLAVEGDFQYGVVDFKSLTGSGTATGPIAASGSFNVSVDGYADTYTFLANAIIAPLKLNPWHGFSPYIGGGVGFTTWDGDIDSISANGATAAVNSSHIETDLAADAVAGIDFALIPQLSIGARYQFLYVDLGDIIRGASNGNFTGHMITLNATYHF